MILKTSAATMAATLLCLSTAYADLDPWDDYEVSKTVWSVTTVKVDPNMDDAYLEGLRNTWVSGNEIAKKLGQITDYAIYRSELPQSGQFNLMLVVEFENSEMLEPNKQRYQAFMKEYGKKTSDEATDFAQENYPAMREITGQYRVRKIELK